MVSKRTLARKKLRYAITREMGIRGKAPLERETRPAIQRMFHRHSEKGPGHALYGVFHEFSKLPRETVTNFVDIERLTRRLKQNPAINLLLARSPALENSFRGTLMDSIRERGIKGSKFWVTAPKEYIDAIIAKGKQSPNAMNLETGKIVAKHFGPTIKPRVVLDIGTFAGGTIGAVVRRLHPEQRKALNVVLVDVAGKIIRGHAVPGLIGLSVPKENIKIIPSSFYNAAVAFRQMQRPLHEKGERRYAKDFIKLIGKVDAIVAGAATINFANDLRPYLKSIKTLLKKDGIFVNWDWGSAEVRSPAIDVPKSKKTILGRTSEGKSITEHDANVSFFNFWLDTLNAPPSVKQKMFAEMENSRKFNFMRWCEKNMGWIEQERIKSGAASIQPPIHFRNRAYRLGGAMREQAIRLGLNASEPIYPIAMPGEKNTGNVNWMMVIKKL